MNREFVGSFRNVTSSLIIGDPLILLPEDALAALVAERDAAGGWPAIHAKANGAWLLSATANYDDGYAWCYVERDEGGTPVRLIVELATRAERAPGEAAQ